MGELAIERLAPSGEIFRSACEDSAVGVETLRRGEHATQSKRTVMVAELRDWLVELEKETRRTLEEAARRSG